MGNKDAGRELLMLPWEEYVEKMGGTSDHRSRQVNGRSTGNDYDNRAIFKYYNELRGYALNRVRWMCPEIPNHELRKIEWELFHQGFCAMVRPRVLTNRLVYTSPHPRVYRCTFTNINRRNGRPRTISLIDNYTDAVVVDINYVEEDFVIFTDQFMFANQGIPFYNTAWEYANKLYNIDLNFKSNSQKQRIPILFNDAGTKKDDDGGWRIKRFFTSIAEMVGSAISRNEQYMSVPEDTVGKDGLLHETQYVTNELSAYLEAQDKIYDGYFRQLGLYTNKEKRGTYVVKEEQQDGDETGDFRTWCWKSTRLMCAEEASEKFKIHLGLEAF